jgi:hypothetical protein
MSTIDLFRMCVASVASVGAAMGGFAASQNGEEVVGVALVRPPLVQDTVLHYHLEADNSDLVRWSEAFVSQPAAIIVAPEAKPWRFVGVIGEGRRAVAVFSAADNPSQTLMAKVGDTLPDGRVIAAIASEHVLFAASAKATGGVESASGVVGPKQIALFAGGDGNAEAAAAFEAAGLARAQTSVSSGSKTASRAGEEPPGFYIDPPESRVQSMSRAPAPASAPSSVPAPNLR